MAGAPAPSAGPKTAAPTPSPTAAAHTTLVQLGMELAFVVGLMLLADSGEAGWHIAATVIVALWVIFFINRLG